MLVCLIGYKAFSHAGDRIRIEHDGQLIGEYPLSEDQTIYLPDTENYTNILIIEDGKAHMDEADCPDKLCINQGKINKAGQTIVCLPNKIVITVLSNADKDFDTVVK